MQKSRDGAAPAKERMLPAPRLPPMLRRARVAAAHEPAAASAPAAAPSRTIDESFLSRAVGVIQVVADTHTTNMQAIADLHQQFLALQWNAAAAPVTIPAAPAPVSAPAARTPLVVSMQNAPDPAPPKPGPKLGRREIEEIATRARTISSVFGPAFVKQDAHRYQIRLPAPPMSIVDRVIGIEGEPGSLGAGRLWSETDITANSWGLSPTGHVSNIVLGESGQANMLLASWLGADLSHDGNHRYRLLELDSTFFGPMPKIGETICVEIALERQALVGGLRLFFYTADIAAGETLRLRAHFSAGLFTEENLARPEQIRWNPERDKRDFEGPLELPPQHRSPRSFSRERVRAFGEGRIFDCFGLGFERALTHIRTPRVATNDLFLLDEVPAFDPEGGPWGRGYLRATQVLSPDDWFFAAHFPGDPCLPGFLLVEGAFQALSFYLVGLGMSLSRDAWRFEQLRGRRYEAKFRGQITPQSTSLVYEIFVESLVAGPVPYILADVTCSIDGRKIFHVRRLALGLLPDWPLDQFRLGPYSEIATTKIGPPPALGGLAGYRNDGPPAFVVDGGIESDYPAMLAFAWGKAQDVFGPSAADNDGALRWPRLPAPPYLFLTRITGVGAEATKARPGAWVESEYQVDERSWYFNENGDETMPFCVMLEAVMQPCGWLMFYVAPLGVVLDRSLRNLDGTATFYEELPRGRATLRVRAELVSESYLGGTRVYICTIRAFVEARCICEVRTTFGVFPPEAMIRQIGLPTLPQDQERIAIPSDFHLDLTTHPSRYFAGALRLAGDMLRGIQRVTAFDEAGGKAGLGWLRGEKDVDPDEWIFKCHFFQDPVQPGSLGLEALLQLLQFFMIERGMGEGIPGARFEPIALGKPVTWKYRGQVLPEHKRIVTEIDVSEIGRDERGPFVVAQGWLWVDGVRVYHATDLGMRIVSGGRAAHRGALQ